MLFGEFYYQIDEKNRLRIPSKLKKNLTECSILKGAGKSLYILPAETLENMYQKLKQVPMFSEEQASLRMIFSSACELEEDNQGRFSLALNLKEFAEIKKDIVFIGVGDRIELWSKENWDAYKAQNLKDYENIVKKLDKYGI